MAAEMLTDFTNMVLGPPSNKDKEVGLPLVVYQKLEDRLARSGDKRLGKPEFNA